MSSATLGLGWVSESGGRDRMSWLERLHIIPIVAVGLLALLIWSYFAMLDEVAVGTGKVTPRLHSQIIQSLEGGIVDGIYVNEGDLAQEHQKLALLDGARFSSSLGEAQAKALSLEAATRLEAEITGTTPHFSAAVQVVPGLVDREMKPMRSRRENLDASSASLREQLTLVRCELALTVPLVKPGAASNVEVIRLQRQESELQGKLDSLRDQFVIDANSDYTKNKADLEVTDQTINGRRDQLNRTILTSPVRGIAKNLEVTTIGGVIQPGGTLMEIVPIEKDLLIETQISPRDIAFIRPGLPATVKITAYDPSIYGSLPGVVERISPDTIQDDVDRRLVYYRVYVRTKSASLLSRDGRVHAIMPGMVASVEIQTGRKSVLDYLIKPFNKAREAMRER